LIVIFSWGLALFESLRELPNFEKHYNTNMNGYVVGGIITAFFLVMWLVSMGKTGFLGRQRWLLAGVITYPLYLLHQNIGFMIFNIAYSKVNPNLLLCYTVLAAVVVAYAVHVFIEKKLSPAMKNFLYKVL
jgi:peptidoglycan/LPS O-acetylase OafA/YrhL